MTTTGRSPGQRAGLTTAAVLAAALDVVRRDGADRLSMRSVATRLGVAPNTLYSHVDGKVALVDALLDDRLRAIADPDPSAHPPGREVRVCMLATFDVLLAEPTLVPLYLARHGSRGPRASELGRALQILLERAGVQPDQTQVVVRVLVLLTIGIAGQAASPEGPLGVALFRDTLSSSVDWIIQGAAKG